MLTSIQVREAIERAEHRFVGAFDGATDAQWRFQPVEGRAWSMPQIVDHVTTSNLNILPVLRDIVVASPRGDQASDFDDDDMPYIFYGGGGPLPPGLENPSGEQTNRAVCVDAVRTSVRGILDWYDSVEVDLRDCLLTHPAFGSFDGAQWLLFIAVHMQQHRGQLLDVRNEYDATHASAQPAP